MAVSAGLEPATYWVRTSRATITLRDNRKLKKEGVRFELTGAMNPAGFRDQCLNPLGQPSIKSHAGTAMLPVARGGQLVNPAYLAIHDERMVGRKDGPVVFIDHDRALMKYRLIRINHIEDCKLAEPRP